MQEVPLLGLSLLLLLAFSVRHAARATWLKRMRVPDIALFIAFGLGAEALLHVAHRPLSTWIAPLAGNGAQSAIAALIICYGGAELRPATLRALWRPIVSLATVGVAASTAMLGALLYVLHIGQLTWLSALLVGSVLAGTDPAAIISILDDVPVEDRARELLIAESSLNDPTSALLTTILLGFTAVSGAPPSLPAQIGGILQQTVLAVVVGTAVGLSARALRPVTARLSFPFLRFAMVYAVTLAISEACGANLFLSAFAAGVLANPLAPVLDGPRIVSKTSHRLMEALLFAARAYIFLLLGLTFPLGAPLHALADACATACLLVLVARPAAVLMSWVGFGRTLRKREIVFLCVNRQTGVIPALLASILVSRHAPGSAMAQLSTAAAVILTSVILLPLFGPLARWLKVVPFTKDPGVGG